MHPFSKKRTKRQLGDSPDITKGKNKQKTLVGFISLQKRPKNSTNVMSCCSFENITQHSSDELIPSANIQEFLPESLKEGKSSENFCKTRISDPQDNILREVFSDMGSMVISRKTEVSDTSLSVEPSETFLTDTSILNGNDSSKDSEDFDLSFAWISELKSCELEMTAPVTGDCSCQSQHKTVRNDTKYKVVEIVHSSESKGLELRLGCPHCHAGHLKKCILRGFWADSIINCGDSVHVLSPFINNCAVVDNSSGFIIINPEILISSTAVVSTLFCMRKAVLAQKLKSWDSSNKVMLVGSLVHQLFQQAVNDHTSNRNDIEIMMQKIIRHPGNLLQIYCQGSSENEMTKELSKYVSSISEWISQYCENKNSSTNVHITEVQDIEDSVWCPRYGIKGKIDLTVKAEKQGKIQHMPLELKTGHPSFSAEHQGQVNLYCLMLEDRTGDKTEGLLLYLKDKVQMREIPADHNAQRGLIQLRNDLAHYAAKSNYVCVSAASSKEHLYSSYYLPDPINNRSRCQKCTFLFPCTIFQRAYQSQVMDTHHPMAELVPEVTGHLREEHLQYLQHWSHLLYLESLSNEVSDWFWTEDACNREKKGLCFSSMVLKDNVLTQQEREGEAYVHTFFRSLEHSVKPSLLTVGIKPGDYVVISGQHSSLEVGLATGHIVTIREDHVQVSVERNIQALERYNGYLFRLDKLIFSTSKSTGFSNLMKLMSPEASYTHLRELIVDRKPPKFMDTMSKSVAVLARPILKSLNKLQRKAVFKALMAKDYMLLKGMPGTGKTATLVAMVRLFVEMGQQVLVTSHTHSAVDNIMMKLQQHNINILRMGHLSRIHFDIHTSSFEKLMKDIRSVDELRALEKSKVVIGATCLGVHHPFLQNRVFDVCIIDEASQITQPDCFGPLFYAKKFVLAGDPMQLPPVVVNAKARLKGMQESLFSRLESPASCSELVVQYRMNREIMHLCSGLSYSGLMQCGSEKIAESVLQLNTPSLLDLKLMSPANWRWLSTALDCRLENSALFINTDSLCSHETEDSDGKTYNSIENKLVCVLTEHLIKLGVLQSDIGIIAPYRQQVELITGNLASSNFTDIEVNTVDQYQGKDKDVVIISCVKSQLLQHGDDGSSSIVSDLRRLNVAISRAKKKLLFVGSKAVMMQYHCFQQLFSLLRSDQILSPTEFLP